METESLRLVNEIMQSNVIQDKHRRYFDESKIIFRDKIFKDFVACINIFKLGYELIFDNCIFEKGASFHFRAINQFTMINSKFLEKFQISSNECIPKVEFEVTNEKHEGELEIDLTEVNDFKIMNSRLNEILIIKNSTKFNNELKIENTKVKLINFQHATIGHSIVISEACEIEVLKVDNLKINNTGNLHRYLIIKDNCKVDECHLKLDFLDNTDISNSRFGKLCLEGKNHSSSYIKIDNIQFDTIQFDKVINKGSITLLKLDSGKESLISFLSSDISRADFINCNFSKGKFEFENSKVSEVFLSETQFPEFVHLNGNINYSQSQLAFGQLSTSFNKQGDSIMQMNIIPGKLSPIIIP
jgi:uncharacterized protein YjbI with pentapeptide repeats